MARIDVDVIARECGLNRDLVRSILTESAGAQVSREVQDRVFKTARRLGYNFRKLKIGKRMTVVRETLESMIAQIERNRSWGRLRILRYLQESIGLIDRVHKRTFFEEYGGLEQNPPPKAPPV